MNYSINNNNLNNNNNSDEDDFPISYEKSSNTFKHINGYH